jgi:hypothetical protein
VFSGTHCGRNRIELRGVISIVRNIDIIDQELRLPAAVRSSIRKRGGQPSSSQIDSLLDARLATSGSRAANHSSG